MVFFHKKLILLTPPLLAFFILGQTNHAETRSSVKVTSEGDSQANVRVETNSDSSTTTTTKSTGRTDIVIECNGVKKEYHSDKAENVTLNCDDESNGTVKSEITVNKNSSPTTKISTNPTETEELKKKTEEIKKEVKSAKDTVTKERNDLFTQMTQMLRELFKNFHF
ncbi:MAG: hypothetical protein RLZZ455_614 [Candidatus Parcubacteria bacterium]|jgi:hypothetical protein